MIQDVIISVTRVAIVLLAMAIGAIAWQSFLGLIDASFGN